ncbi:MAG TPA: heme peroxidase family protein [Baekduia sp.]|nr:heme peroxidase family protein [Baekduia sp.]
MSATTQARPAAATPPAPILPTAPTTPVGRSPHGSLPPRGLERATQSDLPVGRFGRMFRNLPVYQHRRETLIELGRLMIEPAPVAPDRMDEPLGTEDADENVAQLAGKLRLPAGYTYFGQFVDHDITFDPVSSLTRQNDPDGLTNFRTPRYDLDSLYGRGPSDQPYLYDGDGLHLLTGQRVDTDDRFAGPDLLRVPADATTDGSRRALIGDPRNDENLIVSQLQSTMLRFHNKVVDYLGPRHRQLSKDDVLKLAQKTVRWHYQWVVVHDFLVRLVGESVIADILHRDSYAIPSGRDGHLTFYTPKLRFYHWKNTPFMPVEFSVAAYRYGHSMVRPSYLINDFAKTAPELPDVHRIRIFRHGGTQFQSLNGFRPLPPKWGVQWKFFLDGIDDEPGENDRHLPQPSYKIDAELVNPLGELTDATAAPEELTPGGPPNLAQILAVRNLLRGLELGVPSGQEIARAMGLLPLTDQQLVTDQVGGPLTAAAKADLAGNAPLWYYVLKEAEVLADGAHLGPVGGRIVAEVLIGLLVGDPLSYINVAPGWRPDLPGAATPGHYTLSDLVNFANAPRDPFTFGA